ncbi:S10 family peptidase [Massilia glaciei]|uniref:Peptidase S10 n=1 Tax=Massilia glaciei TaxID=1524097 RepID=A0A2U2I4W0_9BURK|nr:peptidase S10 [Massilia glaciei]PWF54844.1 peptidase S10 [Massilia glaciei]
MPNRPTPPRARLTAGLVCAALLLGACGGGGGGASPAPRPTPAPTPPPGSFADPVGYSGASNGALAGAQEGKAVVSTHITLAGKTLAYTATTGHLNATAPGASGPGASFFYVAYTAGNLEAARRPVTFFYNGGPGSSTLWLHMGSFGPRRVVTNYPSTNMPSPAQLVENQETLLDHSDLVFVDAIGTGFSQAVAPRRNIDFWGVDEDAAGFRDFVQRYVAVNGRQASPKFLFGESYGGPRSGVLAKLLEVAGVRLAGVVLQAPAMDYNSNCGVFNPGSISCEAYLPSYAAVSAYHQRATPAPTDFAAHMQQTRDFAAGPYQAAVGPWISAKTTPPADVLAHLAAFTGLSTQQWTQDFSMGPGTYRQHLLPGTMIGRYDGRVSAPLGSALAAQGDPSLTAASATFTKTILSYLQNDLLYTAASSYLPFNDIINSWNFSHDGRNVPDTIPDLAAALIINPDLKIVAMNGYHDLATPFHLTERDLARLGSNPNITVKNYQSGHMSYLDDSARRAQRADMNTLYNSESVAK